jgi:hypothetical protein
MTKLNKILLGAVVLQVLLLVFVYTRADTVSMSTMQPVLPGFDSAQVTRIQVFDKNAEAVGADLVKTGDAWTVANAFGYPVDETKVNDLLQKLAGMKARAPIATSPVRHQQLGVADKAFEKKLVITTGKGDTTILVGAQAEGRTTAVRVAGNAKVYGITNLSPWAVNADPARWINTDYLALDKEQIQRITIDAKGTTTELERTATGWQLDATGLPIALGPGESLDTAAIDALVGHIAAIRITKPGDPKQDATAPAATVSVWLAPADVTIPGGGSGASSVDRPADHVIDIVAAPDEMFWVHDRALATAGLVGKGAIQDVVDATKAKLIKQPAAEPKPGAGGGSGAGSGAGKSAPSRPAKPAKPPPPAPKPAAPPP